MNAITPTRKENFPIWYQEVVKPLAQHGAVRGTQVIKPWGYGVWSCIQSELDIRIKSYGSENFYAPLFVGLNALSQEAKHIEGFATECAVVTHSRLTKKDGALVPDSPLTEPVVVRPTSEAIIGPIVKDWIQSHRDLPLKLNQWANVVRWEMRTRLFLRSSEFLWQEGHTFHQTAADANDFAKTMWYCYQDFLKEVLALPCIIGEKSVTERFSGASQSYTLELLMQDGKALQGGTSHDLGCHFADAYDIAFTSKSGKLERVFGTSWGLTTRLIGALVMVHGDDDGLRLPPRVATQQVVIIPINPKNDSAVDQMCQQVHEKLSSMHYHQEKLRVKIDNRDIKGNKSWEWVKKGVPIRIEIGPRDLEKGSVCVSRRDQGVKEKTMVALAALDCIPDMLTDIQESLLDSAQQFLNNHTIELDTKDALLAHFENGGVGMVKIPYIDNIDVEKELVQHQLSVRCLIDGQERPCGFSGEPTTKIAVIAKAY